MRFIAWNAKMNQPVKTGGTLRDNLEAGAAHGNPIAIRMLQGPRLPVSLEILWVWFTELRIGAGQGLNGIAPLTWTEVDAWARQTRAQPYLHEIKALFSLDLVARDPESFEKEEENQHHAR